MKQSIFTQEFNYALYHLNSERTAINDAFMKMFSQVKGMDSSYWISRAGNQAETTLHTLASFNAARDDVLRDYALFLKNTVERGYMEAEKGNVSLADYFR